jgi:GTP-binding protein HflX
MTRSPQSTAVIQPRTFLFGVKFRGSQDILSMDDSLSELAQLCRTAGLEVVGQDIQRLSRADPSTLIGSGKVVELKRWLTETCAGVVVFDEELSPRHLRELQKGLGEEIYILDRTAIILDIFAQHAHSREGALQVELAQYAYRLPRLTRAWTHLARQAGGAAGRGGTGGVGLRGPGETQLEIDRREITRKITRLKRELELVREQRSRHRSRRRKSGVVVAALVGYTNAGKSTLLNALTRSHVLVADQLFATLDPTTRRVALPNGKIILLTDTVGFIQKLPAALIAAFRATLEEISEADILLHVVDVTHPNAQEQAAVVHRTLRSLEVPDDLPMVTALNKTDLLENPSSIRPSFHAPRTVMISAVTGDGIPDLLQALEDALFHSLIPVHVHLPFSAGRLVDVFHTEGTVESVVHRSDGVRIRGRLPPARLRDFQPYIISSAGRKQRGEP